MLDHIRTTILAGILAFLPLFVVIYVLLQAFTALNAVIAPIIDSLGINSALGTVLVFLLSVFGLLAVIYGLGLIARFGIVASGLDKIERNLASRVPVYGFIKSIVTGAIDETETEGFATIELDGPHGARIGFIVDTLPDGRVAVFLPDVPNPRTGQSVIVDESACRPVDVAPHKVFEALTAFGRGVGDGKTSG